MEFLISDSKQHSAFIAYLYNGLAGTLKEGRAELDLGKDRAKCRVFAPGSAAPILYARMTEVIAVGYKYYFLDSSVHVCMPKKERGLLLSSLIAADLETDGGYILPRLESEREFCLDGLFAFRMGALREKWGRIAEYIPETFSARDLKNFSRFLVSESRRTVYLKDSRVFGENFTPLRLSRLTGEESVEREIMLADAGYIKCLGGISGETGEFLQKYYPERVAFS